MNIPAKVDVLSFIRPGTIALAVLGWGCEPNLGEWEVEDCRV